MRGSKLSSKSNGDTQERQPPLAHPAPAHSPLQISGCRKRWQAQRCGSLSKYRKCWKGCLNAPHKGYYRRVSCYFSYYTLAVLNHRFFDVSTTSYPKLWPKGLCQEEYSFKLQFLALQKICPCSVSRVIIVKQNPLFWLQFWLSTAHSRINAIITGLPWCSHSCLRMKSFAVEITAFRKQTPSSPI